MPPFFRHEEGDNLKLPSLQLALGQEGGANLKLPSLPPVFQAGGRGQGWVLFRYFINTRSLYPLLDSDHLRSKALGNILQKSHLDLMPITGKNLPTFLILQ
mgnify:CR=1 FL=1